MPRGETLKTVSALKKLEGFLADVVVGALNPKLNEISALIAEDLRFKLHRNISNIASLIAHADFGFGAGGTSLLERCFLGLPTAVTQVAQNQIENTKALAKLNVIRDLGWHEDIAESQILSFAQAGLSDSSAFAEMRQRALKLMGPEVGTVKVVKLLRGENVF